MLIGLFKKRTCGDSQASRGGRQIPLFILLFLFSLTSSAQSLDLPARSASELANLREGVTLAGWKSAHSSDLIVSYSHRYSYWGNWIARAESRAQLPDGRE